MSSAAKMVSVLGCVAGVIILEDGGHGAATGLVMLMAMMALLS